MAEHGVGAGGTGDSAAMWLVDRTERVRLCECGCGEPTALSRWGNKSRGLDKGQPLRFRSGHNRRVEIFVPNLSRYIVAGRDCWLWTGSRNHRGYGRLQVAQSTRPAHRAMWESLHGPLPREVHLDHLCRHRACINPAHLECVSLAENNRRMHAQRNEEKLIVKAQLLAIPEAERPDVLETHFNTGGRGVHIQYTGIDREKVLAKAIEHWMRCDPWLRDSEPVARHDGSGQYSATVRCWSAE